MNAPPALHPTAGARRVSFDLAARTLVLGAPAVLLIGALTWPLYFSSSSFLGSWLLDLWFMWKQSLSLSAGHLPGLFLNYQSGVFYPEYVFYGGTLFTLTGALSLVLGGTPVVAYVLTYLLAFGASYGGWYWIARQAGLDRWQAQIPGIVLITSSFYLTMIYADGDWPEFIAVSMIPLVIAAGLSILRSDRLRVWPALALTISCVFFFGSHALTLVWGSTMLVLVGLASVIGVPRARTQISRAGLIRLARVVVPSLLVCGWFLVPAAAYESTTWIGNQPVASIVRSSMPLVSTRHLFTLSRATAAPGNAGFALSLPVLAMAWALVGIALALSASTRGTWTRVLMLCAGFTTLVIVLMTHAGLILTLPRYYASLQYSYRLENYVLLGLSGTVLSILVLAKDGGPRLRAWTRWALPPVLLAGIIGAVLQTAAYPSTADRDATIAGWPAEVAGPGTSYLVASSAEAVSSGGVFKDYIDVRQPILNGPQVHESLVSESDVHPPTLPGSFEHLAMAHFDTATAQGKRISAQLRVRPGELVNSNLFGPSSFVHVTGAKIVGINDGSGADVLEIDPASSHSGSHDSAAATRSISVTPAAGFPLILGRVLSICGVLALALQFGLLATRRRA